MREDTYPLYSSATVARMDAGFEPPGMGLRRVAEVNTESVSATDSSV
jgi:hypothetical protein